MAIYEYRCQECGTFDVRHPIGEAPQEDTCGVCGRMAPRRYTPPSLRQVSPALLQ